MRRVALYARVSTPEQDPAPQVERLRTWAVQAGYTVHMERVDYSSGRKVVRPGMQEILQAARGRHIHAVAVAKVDRWARSVQHLATSVAELHGLGIDFMAVDQGLMVRKGDPTSSLVLSVLAGVAEWEAGIISERTKDALRSKAPGMGAGRHRRSCGVSFPCPTGAHPKNGMPVDKEKIATI